MTKITHRRVLGIALPIVLSNATIPLLGIVDTAVVGQLGAAEPVGAVAIGAVVLTSLYWLFGFLRMGTVGLVSQALGRRDTAEVSALLTRCLMIGFGAGTVFILLQKPLFAGALVLASPSLGVEGLARDYLQIRIWSAPAMIALYGISGWLIAQERSRAFMMVQIWTNGINILLDIWFVLGLGWGVGGVAFASVIAEWSGFAVGLWFCKSAFVQSAAWRDWGVVLSPAKLKHMATVNTDILVRSLLLQAMFTSFTFLGAREGDLVLAANQVLLQMLMLTAFGMDGFAFAAETLVGQSIGAGRRDQLRRSVGITSFWGAVVVIVMSALFVVFGGGLIDLMTTAHDVRDTARLYLPYLILAPLLGWASWMLDGIFIGATASRDMRDMMIVSSLIYLGAVLVLFPTLGNHGLWLALLVSFIARGITLWRRYPKIEARVVHDV